MPKTFAVYVNGQKAVNAGRKYCGGRCTKQIVVDGKPAGQLEVVIDDNGSYNGNPNKWVAVSFIKTGADVEKVINALAAIGFRGCPCEIQQETIVGCYAKQTTLCCMVI